LLLVRHLRVELRSQPYKDYALPLS